ncbi:MAG: OmpA family protein [Bacteroidota bacterium]
MKITAKSLPNGKLQTACDCRDAVNINVEKVTSYGLTIPPIGFGTIQEIKSKNKKDKFSFEEEHNTAWYLLNIKFEGDFVFEIIPQDTTNDYDFLLYKYTDTSFCEKLLRKEQKPIRSNLSRISTLTKGNTGLSADAVDEFVNQGIHAPFSKFIHVKKGEKYMLVLDNVYPEGKGHTIKFNYVKQVTISGVVTDADSLPVKTAEVSLTNEKGIVIKQLTTGMDGKYFINTTLKENVNYTLVFSSDSSFISTQTLNTKDLESTNSFNDIRTILPKLKKGSKYKLSSINFVGDAATLLMESYASVEALSKLMLKNKRMVIRIEGHINGTSRQSNKDCQTLSESRAKTVYNFLIKKGIEKERMSIVGFAAKKMLYPYPKDEKESSANRRVEINVISIN